MNAAYSSRTYKLSTLGRGAASTLKKAYNISTFDKLESETWEDYERRGSQVYGVIADQGNEAGVADMDDLTTNTASSSRIPGTFAEGHGRRYPRAIYMPEHLHIMNNALKAGVEKLENHGFFMNSLRGMERFLSDKSLRRLFVARCLGGWEHPDAWMFASYSTVHIDWRWEMLEVAFKKLIPLMKTLVANFSVEN